MVLQFSFSSLAFQEKKDSIALSSFSVISWFLLKWPMSKINLRNKEDWIYLQQTNQNGYGR